MNAKATEPARIEEAWNVGCLLQRTLAYTGISHETFTHPANLQERLAQEGLTNYVYRIVEELGALTHETKERYDTVDWQAIRGLRNILAHAYGDVSHETIWEIIERDIPGVLEFCQAWADDNGITLEDNAELDED
jgi:uncharacterized protein with HEPN domain